jgi:hypothetical protein
MTYTTIVPGITLAPGYLDRTEQDALLAAVRAIVAEAPLYVRRACRGPASRCRFAASEKS